MNRFKKIILAMLLLCLCVCLGVAVSACDNTDKPDIINPGDDPDKPKPGESEYKIKVQSLGGLALNNVKLTIGNDDKNVGDYVTENGEVTFNAAPAVYNVTVDADTLPKGYILPANADYKTSETNKTLTISLNSEVISEGAPAGTFYNVGDIMYDFTFTDVDGVSHSLKQALTTKKAVMLNFWGTTCSPCRVEFPAIESAYKTYKDRIEIFALSSYGNDTEDRVKNFKDTNNYTFPMALDTVEGTYIYRYFNVSAYPTTVIVDRYGAVAYKSSGTNSSEAAWNALFDKYTSDDYSQDEITDNPGGTFDWVKPSGETMPDSAAIEAAINTEDAKGRITYSYDFNPDTNNDAENNWPWILKDVDGNQVFAPSNIPTDHTYSIFNCTVSLKAGDGFSYDYFIDTKSSYNYLHVIINDKLAESINGTSNGWKTSKIYVANRAVKLNVSFCLIKIDVVAVDTPCYIRQMDVYNAAADGESNDLAYSVTENAVLDNGKYDLKIFEKDGLYYCTYKDNENKDRTSILYADILSVTHWAEKHFGTTFKVIDEGKERDVESSLYLISFWQMSEGKEQNRKLIYDQENYIFRNYYLQSFSPNNYVPVTPLLVEKINAFLDTAYKMELVKGERYEDEWLEFCYYMMHWGKNHSVCYEKDNPVQGFTFEFANDAVVYDENNENETVNHVNVTTMFNLTISESEAGGGLKYKFTPDKTGIYLFQSSFEKAQTDPAIYIYDSQYKSVAGGDNDLRFDHFERADYENFYVYAELQAGETYYITAMINPAGSTGEFDYTITYAGTYVEYLRICTTHDGMWLPRVDEDGNFNYNDVYYGAIPVAFNPDTNCYHAVESNYDFGSVIYVDFVNTTFFGIKGRNEVEYYSLYEYVNVYKLFDDVNGNDYRDEMLAYYEKAMANSGELKGLVEVDQRLFDILNDFMNSWYNDSPDAGGWLMFASYYETFGVKPEN